MILKLIGSFLIIFSSYLIGYSKTLKLKEEVQLINIFMTFFNFARVDILNTRLTIDEIIKNFCLNSKRRYEHILNYYLNSSNQKIDEVKNVYQIDNEVHRTVLTLFDAIACSSITEIDRLISDGIRQLHEDYTRVKEQYIKNAKLFTMLGFFCGISICIILL